MSLREFQTDAVYQATIVFDREAAADKMWSQFDDFCADQAIPEDVRSTLVEEIQEMSRESSSIEDLEGLLETAVYYLLENHCDVKTRTDFELRG